MDINRENILKEEIINSGRKLYNLRFAAASSGNLSARLNENAIFITVAAAALGSLRDEDIIKVDLNNEESAKINRLTSEFPLHRLIYKNSPCQVIIHCHPPLINGYFAVYSDIKALTFETKLFLGSVPVIEQDTPSVTKPELVIEALGSNNLVILKHHGVVVVGNNFKDALNLIETLEEAVKTVAVARIFKKEVLDDLDRELKQTLISKDSYSMFSQEHIQAIVDLVNKDEFIKQKGRELNLTLNLAIKLNEDGRCYKFTFDKGRITKLEFDGQAPFVISAPAQIWQLVFLGKLDPFVAVTQGKMKLVGQLGELSRWYVPFSRLFELFKQVEIK